MSKYMALNCDTGFWNTDWGYSVQNSPGRSLRPVDGKQGWYELTRDGKTPHQLKSLSTKLGSQLTRVGHQERFLCPNL